MMIQAQAGRLVGLNRPMILLAFVAAAAALLGFSGVAGPLSWPLQGLFLICLLLLLAIALLRAAGRELLD